MLAMETLAPGDRVVVRRLARGMHRAVPGVCGGWARPDRALLTAVGVYIPGSSLFGALTLIPGFGATEGT